MNIVILSGGSGNDSLVTGLKSFYPNSKIDIIINEYDNGKSTGICREVTNTLGVSDARKNHIRLYQATHSPLEIDKRLVEFYENRYDFTRGEEVWEICDKLSNWCLHDLIPYAVEFFRQPKANDFEYKDFNVANIVYSEMYREKGYENTHRYFSNLLGIDDCVHLNSFENIYLQAITESGNVIDDEGAIVEYYNSNDPICGIRFSDPFASEILNPVAIDLVTKADLIIISTGTFWSSIYPTLAYGDFYKHINYSKAKKIWAINNEEDKDSYGVSSNDFIYYMTELGLNLDDFVILENLEAVEPLRQKNDDYNIKYFHMGNFKGKHAPEEFVYGILACYYDLDVQYEKILFDFDDTLCARECNKYNNDNLNLLNYFNDNAYIISGNSYRSIYDKLTFVWGTELKNFKPIIVADANSAIYKNNQKIDYIDSVRIDNDIIDAIVEDINTKFNLVPYNISNNCIKYKPLTTELERDLLVEYINNILNFPDVVAKKTGKTTVDVLNVNNDKSKVYDKLNLDKYLTLYIGDEIDSGNDYAIARRCTKFIRVKDVEETNVLLTLLLNMGDIL